MSLFCHRVIFELMDLTLYYISYASKKVTLSNFDFCVEFVLRRATNCFQGLVNYGKWCPLYGKKLFIDFYAELTDCRLYKTRATNAGEEG